MNSQKIMGKKKRNIETLLADPSVFINLINYNTTINFIFYQIWEDGSENIINKSNQIIRFQARDIEDIHICCQIQITKAPYRIKMRYFKRETFFF